MSDTNKEDAYCIFVYASSYDFKLLDIAMKTIYNHVKQGGIKCNPPRPNPTKNVYFTIRRAPSIYKSSFEKFRYSIHYRVLSIKETTDLNELKCLSKADIPRAVNISVKAMTKVEYLARKNKKQDRIK